MPKGVRQLGKMLAPGFMAAAISGEGPFAYTKLSRHEREYRSRRPLTGGKNATGISKVKQHHREPKLRRGGPLGGDQRTIFRTEHAVPNHPAFVSRRFEQSCPQCVGEQPPSCHAVLPMCPRIVPLMAERGVSGNPGQQAEKRTRLFSDNKTNKERGEDRIRPGLDGRPESRPATRCTRHGGLRSLTEEIDTTTPGGRLILQVFGALGQFKRDLIRERTRAGLKAAGAHGRRGGRKPVVTEEKLRRARQLMAKGLTAREAAARIKVGKTALYKALQPLS